MRTINIIALLICVLTVAVKAQDNGNFEIELNNQNINSKNQRFYRPTAFKSIENDAAFSIGGYADGNSQYFVTDGESEGLHFKLNGINLFSETSFYNNRIQFFTNVAFTPGNIGLQIKEAALNINFHKALNLRGGVIIAPLGYYNQNSDAVLYNFIDAPIASKTILPGGLSEMGFGLNGTFQLQNKVTLTYEAYLVNGLQNEIVNNDLPKTYIPLGIPENIFAADNNNKIAATGRIGLKLNDFGELGYSYYGGQYNTTEVDEVEIDEARNLSIHVIDAQVKFKQLKLYSEVVFADIDVFDGLGQIFGEQQFGYHIEASYPLINNISLFGKEDNQLNLAARFENADYNVGIFEQTETNVYDSVTGIKTGLSFRMGSKAILKANYSYNWQKDILGNQSQTGGYQFGFATYF